MISFLYFCIKFTAMRTLITIIASFMLFMCSCTTTKTVEVPVEKVRTEYIQNTRIDSVFMRDSVDRWMKGDTVYIYKERTRYRYINNTDTVCRTDTVTDVVTVDVVREVEVNHIKWYQKVLMSLGAIALVLMGYRTYKRLT